MKNRYRLKRGRRSAGQYDVLIYSDDQLLFRGAFVTKHPNRLTSEDIKIMNALKAGLEMLNS